MATATAELITDGAINADAYSEWLSVLMSMWESVEKPVDEKRLKLYASQFESVPLGLLEKAITRAIRNNGNYLSVPSIGALWSAIRKETGDLPNVDVLEAVEMWQEKQTAMFDSRVVRFG